MKIDKSASFKQCTILPWIELRVANQSTACYDTHSHDEFSFGIIDQGCAEYRNRRQSHRIGKGDIVTINPADPHSCNPEAGTWSYSMLFIDAFEMGAIQRDMLKQVRGLKGEDYQPFHADFERDRTLRSSYLRLFQSLQSESDVLQVESHLYDFIQTSLRLGSVQNVPEQPSGSLRRVQEKLLDEINGPHQLEQLAQEAEMSRYQLLRAFKHHFGLPPHSYLLDEKIKRAKVMLKSGQEISQVAYELGFSDQAHFQRQFKKRLAVTPKYYQSHFVD